MNLEFALRTDKGGRNINEDSADAYVSEGFGCFVLADGLGGHGMGDVASGIAVKVAMERLKSEGTLDEAFLAAQETVLEEQKRLHAESQMKTTMCILRIRGNCAELGHIGDSRIYRFKNGKLERRTKDHSLLQVLVDAGELKEEEIRFHEDRNKLLRAIGTDWDGECYELAAPLKLASRDLFLRPVHNVFLIVSDGWWELVTEEEMEITLKQAKTAEEWLVSMEQILQEKKTEEMDNYTAIAVFAG